MLARVFSCAVIGLDGVIVEVEVDTGEGLLSTVMIGNSGLALCLTIMTYRSVVPCSRKQDTTAGPAIVLPFIISVL
jgi:hypothetical protein